MDRISVRDKKRGVLALFIITKELFIGFAGKNVYSFIFMFPNNRQNLNLY